MFDNGMFLESYARSRHQELVSIAEGIRRGSERRNDSDGMLRVRFGLWLAEKGVRLAGIREQFPRNTTAVRRALCTGCSADA
jgi:hypothetical protein